MKTMEEHNGGIGPDQGEEDLFAEDGESDSSGGDIPFYDLPAEEAHPPCGAKPEEERVRQQATVQSLVPSGEAKQKQGSQLRGSEQGHGGAEEGAGAGKGARQTEEERRSGGGARPRKTLPSRGGWPDGSFSNLDPSTEQSVRVLLLGSTGAGKTSLMQRYCDNVFHTSFGIDFKLKKIRCGGIPTKVQVWDTAGQERFRTITTAYLRGANALAFVFDLGNRRTLDDVSYWMDQIRTHQKQLEAELPVVIMGNKVDKDQDPGADEAVGEVSVEEVQARYGSVPYFQVSALSGKSVDAAFDDVIGRVLEKRDRAAGGGSERGSERLSGKEQAAAEKKSSCSVS